MRSFVRRSVLRSILDAAGKNWEVALCAAPFWPHVAGLVLALNLSPGDLRT